MNMHKPTPSILQTAQRAIVELMNHNGKVWDIKTSDHIKTSYIDLFDSALELKTLLPENQHLAMPLLHIAERLTEEECIGYASVYNDLFSSIAQHAPSALKSRAVNGIENTPISKKIKFIEEINNNDIQAPTPTQSLFFLKNRLTFSMRHTPFV